jgi:hypothetical protein
MLKNGSVAPMRKTIATGMLGLALYANAAAAQTATEQTRIVGDFQRSVADYTQRQTCLGQFPVSVSAAMPAPQVFTLPVGMVFRQLIARTLAAPGGVAVSGPKPTHRPAILQPFPANELFDFPKLLLDALPSLPAPLEYRLIGNDLVIRDTEADIVIAVLRDALGGLTTR